MINAASFTQLQEESREGCGGGEKGTISVVKRRDGGSEGASACFGKGTPGLGTSEGMYKGGLVWEGREWGTEQGRQAFQS